MPNLYPMTQISSRIADESIGAVIVKRRISGGSIYALHYQVSILRYGAGSHLSDKLLQPAILLMGFPGPVERVHRSRSTRQINPACSLSSDRTASLILIPTKLYLQRGDS